MSDGLELLTIVIPVKNEEWDCGGEPIGGV